MTLDDIISSFQNNTMDGITVQDPDDYRYFTFDNDEEYGVMLEIPDSTYDIDEEFSQVRFYTRLCSFDSGVTQKFLVLSCDDRGLLNKFAGLCEDFVNPGEDGKKRKETIKDPRLWWNDWKSLLGNISSDQEAYSVIGEMMVYDYLWYSGCNPHWEGPLGITKDISCSEFDVEVKSTKSRYSYNIESAGEYQFDDPNRDLVLFFCRFEKSDGGMSLDDLAALLVSKGVFDPDCLEKWLSMAGFPHGKMARQYKYRMLEMLCCNVDNQFPCIRPSSFVLGTVPPGVSHIRYDIDLSTVKDRCTVISYDSGSVPEQP